MPTVTFMLIDQMLSTGTVLPLEMLRGAESRARAEKRSTAKSKAQGARSEDVGEDNQDTALKLVTASIDGAPVKLTSHEFRLISYMAHHQDRVISRSELVEHIYDQDFDRDSNTIEVFIGRLRKKIGSDRIETVRGLGYRLIDPDAKAA